MLEYVKKYAILTLDYSDVLNDLATHKTIAGGLK